jgi:Na+/H+-dicarboxylate symporter
MKAWVAEKGLTFWITAATFLGIIAGFFMGPKAAMLEPLGDIFMSLIKMVIVPLVFLSITLGAASLDDVKKAGRIGAQAMAFYLTTTVLAVIIALIFGSLFQPGVGVNKEKVKGLMTTETSSTTEDDIKTQGIAKTLLGIIPTNPLQAMLQGNMLQIIFFAAFLGLAMAGLPSEKKAPVMHFLEGLNQAFIIMVHAVMCTAPFGVFGLMAVTVGVFGFETIWMLVKLLLVYVFCVVLHFFLVYCGALRLLTGLSPITFLRKMEIPLLVSFTTASSLVTLPTSMETAEKEFAVSPEVSSFVLPLGATVNMDGSAINFGLYAVFGLQFFGGDLTMEKALLIILTATLGSIGTAGVPGPSVLTISVLNAAGVHLSILPLFIATDRIFDMIRTSINISGDITCAIIVDHFNPSEKPPNQDLFE